MSVSLFFLQLQCWLKEVEVEPKILIVESTNQLQELAQRSCFNLPSYTCIREGPDHAPRFKATVNFNGEIFDSPLYSSTLRQAEHSAAELALNSLSIRAGPSHSLAAKILDETGVYKNLLQEIAQRVGAPLPQYTTYRTGLGHLPVFMGTVDLAGIIFSGEPAKNKKQAEKNAAMAAWSSLKLLAKDSASSSEPENNDELEQITIARAFLNYRLKEKLLMGNSSSAPIPFTKKFSIHNQRPTSPQPPQSTSSKILPLICPKAASRNRPPSSTLNDRPFSYIPQTQSPVLENHSLKFPAIGATPYIPIQQFRTSCRGMAPPVTIRTAVPVYAAPPVSPSSSVPPHMMRGSHVPFAPPVTIRQAQPVFSARPLDKLKSPSQVQKENFIPLRKEDPRVAQKEEFPSVDKKEHIINVKEEDLSAAIYPGVVNKSAAQALESEGKIRNCVISKENLIRVEEEDLPGAICLVVGLGTKSADQTEGKIENNLKGLELVQSLDKLEI
ncbi:hypothetical protein ACFE04_005812 [Oxalis oulophora]